MKFLLPAAMLVVLAAPAAPAGEARADDAGQPAYWGSPSVDAGKCCQTLAEVRENIDRLDQEIVKLMAERQKYVGEAARFKKDPAAVSAPARVEAIIAKIKALSAEEGLAPEVGERAFRAMIAAFEDFERAEWTRKNPTPAK